MYKLQHNDEAINHLLSENNMDVCRLAIRDYTTAREKGESHSEAFEFVEHRFLRYNSELLMGLSVVEV